MASTDELGPRAASPTVTVGITGHRFLAHTEQLIPHVDDVLDTIAGIWQAASLTVISALAEGSDRLVVRRIFARPHSWLVVPLPMPVPEYLKDFGSEHSRDEFHELVARAHRIVRFPPSPTRPAAYEQAGRYIIEHCDALVALWNGQPPLGHGGTGAVVTLARAKKRPLAWIYADNHMPGNETVVQTVKQGTVTYENFPSAPR